MKFTALTHTRRHKPWPRNWVEVGESARSRTVGGFAISEIVQQ
jgi:hypothetical protein